MIFYGILGIGIYLLFKKSPDQGKNMLQYANNFVKYMPIDKSSIDLFSPIFDITSKNESSFMESFNNVQPSQNMMNYNNQKILHSGKGSTKRSVSETKKKYVAANQGWKCGHCEKQLNHTFEIDHKIRLEYGGDNDVQNLIALCRNCHGVKTASENM